MGAEVTPTMNQPLFFKPPELVKVAGYKMPTNPAMWKSEIIRYLKAQHPYLPLERADIDMRRTDATKGAAVGSIVLDGKIVVPVIINRPRPGSQPELAPMDVFFHEGRYHYLDPEAIRHLTHRPQVGTPEPGHKSRAMGGNPYIGDVTGDATPLEYSGQASPFAGPFDGTKVSHDISAELLPDWLLKEANEKLKERGRAAARGSVMFGTSGVVGGAIRGALTGKGVKGRAAEALRQAGKGLAGGVGAGAAVGAASPTVERALGIAKAQKKEQTQAIKSVVKRELAKSASAELPMVVTAGVSAVAEGGLLSRLVKAAYLEPNDVANFRQLLASNPHVLQGSSNNLELVEIVSRRGPSTPGTRGNAVKYPNILQVYRRPLTGELCYKFSGGPETRATKEELKTMLGDRYDEVMSRLRSGNVFMQHDGVQRASWDAVRPMREAKPVNHDGLYSVRMRDGQTMVGMVAKSVMDLDGKTLPLKLFVSPDGHYALTGEMFGTRLADKHRIPSSRPAAGQTGVFINYVHGTPIATVPLTMLSTHVTGEGDGARVVHMVSNPMTGEKFALSPVRRVQGFQHMRVVDPGVQSIASGAKVYFMPGDSEWVPLRAPVAVAGAEEDLAKIAADAEATSLTFSSGSWHVATKTASWLDLGAPEARELMLGMGMDADEAQAIVEFVRDEVPGHDAGVKLSGLHDPQIFGFEIVPAEEPVFSPAVVKLAAECRPGDELVKTALETGHPETLDSVLSLQFITPQNMKYFTDNIEDFDEAASRIAALLIAVRLGMPHIPEQPLRDALEGLSRIVNKLRILKSATENKNERTYSNDS